MFLKFSIFFRKIESFFHFFDFLAKKRKNEKNKIFSIFHFFVFRLFRQKSSKTKKWKIENILFFSFFRFLAKKSKKWKNDSIFLKKIENFRTFSIFPFLTFFRFFTKVPMGLILVILFLIVHWCMGKDYSVYGSVLPGKLWGIQSGPKPLFT